MVLDDGAATPGAATPAHMPRQRVRPDSSIGLPDRWAHTSI